MTCDDGHDLTLLARLRHAGRTRFFRARIGTREDAAASGAPRLHFAAKRLKGEWLIVVSNIPGARPSPPIANAGRSSACSATPRPAA